MATARDFEKSALVMGILTTSLDRQEELFGVLEKEFGPIFKATELMDFPYTDYYDSEMEGRPKRQLLLFEKLIDPSTLADIKTKTNELEKHFAGACGRKVNLDPGLLSLSSFILATCKDRSHRIPLKNGIYAETTMIFQNHDFQKLPWTYADYGSDEIRAILRDFRNALKSGFLEKDVHCL